MTTLTITIPDNMAKQARQAGLLEPDQVVALIDQALRTHQAAAQLHQLTDRLDANPPAMLSDAEIQAEIDAYRRDKRAQTGC